MKTLNLLIISICLVSICKGQTDTIYSNNERIPCIVKEVTPEAVKYSYEGEDLQNSIYRNAVQKIVFKSGRVQIFSEATFFKKVDSVEEYNNVTITQVESEVKGLFKIGEVSSKAKGGTTMSNQERVKERAYKKLRIQAAMQGANIIYITYQRSEGNKGGGLYQASVTAETSLVGVAYSNQVPNFNEFNNILGNKRDFLTVKETKLWSSWNDFKQSEKPVQFRIDKIINENGLIMLEGNLQGVSNYSKFRVVSFTKESFNIYFEDKKTVYNYKIML